MSASELPLRSIDVTTTCRRAAKKKRKGSAGKKAPAVRAILEVIDFSESEREMEEQLDDDLFVVPSHAKPG